MAATRSGTTHRLEVALVVSCVDFPFFDSFRPVLMKGRDIHDYSVPDCPTPNATKKQDPRPREVLPEETVSMPHSKSILLLSQHLHLLKNTLLELPLNLLALLVRGRLAVESHQGAEVELGLLEQLDLADVNL